MIFSRVHHAILLVMVKYGAEHPLSQRSRERRVRVTVFPRDGRQMDALALATNRLGWLCPLA